jgi:hypothetical protein
VILAIGGGFSLLVGAYLSFQSRAETKTAAAIENGEHPNSYSRYDDRYVPRRTEIVGRLVQADAVVVPGRKTRIYAPLVSERAGADEHPRIYFGAVEAAYDREAGDQRFRGILSPLPARIRAALESHGHAVGDDVYLLEDDGFQNNAAAGRALLIWGTRLAILGILSLLFAARRQATRRPEPVTEQ